MGPGQPYLDRVIVRVIVDAAAAAAALEAGDTQISFFSSVPRTDLARLAQDPHFRVSTKGNEAYTIFNTLGFNTRRKELSDVRVRRAIAHSLDLENSMAKSSLARIWQARTRPGPHDVIVLRAGSGSAYPYDPQKAEALLDEAGYKRGPDGIRLTHAALMPNTSDDVIHMFATFIQQSLCRRSEYKVDNQVSSTSSAISPMSEPRTGISISRPTPTCGAAIPASARRSGTVRAFRKERPGATNGAGNPRRLDKDVDDAKLIELDPVKRKAFYGDFAKIANTDIPVWMAVEQVFVTGSLQKHASSHSQRPDFVWRMMYSHVTLPPMVLGSAGAAC